MQRSRVRALAHSRSGEPASQQRAAATTMNQGVFDWRYLFEYQIQRALLLRVVQLTDNSISAARLSPCISLQMGARVSTGPDSKQIWN
jgi:hypothetical protein